MFIEIIEGNHKVYKSTRTIVKLVHIQVYGFLFLLSGVYQYSFDNYINYTHSVFLLHFFWNNS